MSTHRFICSSEQHTGKCSGIHAVSEVSAGRADGERIEEGVRLEFTEPASMLWAIEEVTGEAAKYRGFFRLREFE